MISLTSDLKGIRLKGNVTMYAEVEQRMQFYINIAKKNIYLLIVTAMFPIVRVTFDWCLGSYTVDSWIFFISFW